LKFYFVSWDAYCLFVPMVWRGRTFQQVVTPTCSLVLPYQVTFGNKTVLEPSRGGDDSTNLGGSRGANLDKNT